LKWFYGIKFKVSTISFPQKYILKFTAITITGLSEPEGHWLSKSLEDQLTLSQPGEWLCPPNYNMPHTLLDF
jgi:hypothetical protein